jgi:tetratricopeptide (TPR) repeat protein
MNKSFLIITFISIVCVGALFSLPKIIVGDKKKSPMANTANRDKPQKATIDQKEEHDEEENHASDLNTTQQKKLNELKAAFANATTTTKEATGQKLIKLLESYQKYDSAAFYSEQLLTSNPNEKGYLTTADLYYQAFTYAVNDTKSNQMGEKTRAFYQKALNLNPNLLLAKTNMAMTYVTTPTPMQGIMLLREVVAQSPDFEPALFNLGILSMRSNQFAKAVERFKHITKNNPNNTKASFYQGVCLARLGRNDEAKEILQKVKLIDKDPAVQAEISSLLSELN